MSTERETINMGIESKQCKKLQVDNGNEREMVGIDVFWIYTTI